MDGIRGGGEERECCRWGGRGRGGDDSVSALVLLKNVPADVFGFRGVNSPPAGNCFRHSYCRESAPLPPPPPPFFSHLPCKHPPLFPFTDHPPYIQPAAAIIEDVFINCSNYELLGVLDGQQRRMPVSECINFALYSPQAYTHHLPGQKKNYSQKSLII